MDSHNIHFNIKIGLKFLNRQNNKHIDTVLEVLHIHKNLKSYNVTYTL